MRSTLATLLSALAMTDTNSILVERTARLLTIVKQAMVDVIMFACINPRETLIALVMQVTI